MKYLWKKAAGNEVCFKSILNKGDQIRTECKVLKVKLMPLQEELSRLGTVSDDQVLTEANRKIDLGSTNAENEIEDLERRFKELGHEFYNRNLIKQIDGLKVVIAQLRERTLVCRSAFEDLDRAANSLNGNESDDDETVQIKGIKMETSSAFGIIEDILAQIDKCDDFDSDNFDITAESVNEA